MSYKVIATPRFEKEIKRLAKKYHSIKSEYSELLDELEKEPNTGTPIGAHCYKIRLSIESKGKGKSGGARIITYVLVADTTVYLLSIYDKSEQADITDKELQQLVSSIKK
jgi:mRNA-degrading endonuclease RelE of RelBE toxin-antitoxin system